MVCFWKELGSEAKAIKNPTTLGPHSKGLCKQETIFYSPICLIFQPNESRLGELPYTYIKGFFAILNFLFFFYYLSSR